MVWPFTNNQQPAQQQNGALNLGLPGAQQQVPHQYTGSTAAQNGGYNPYAPPPPPSEMDILSAMITSNPSIDKWLSDNNGANMNMLISLLSSVVAVSVQTILSNTKLVEKDNAYTFDFSGVQGLPTADSVTMTQTQILNQASNNVQQINMQFQQMVQIANQSSLQGMLDNALTDPGMMQNVGGGLGSLVRGLATGGR